MVKYDKIYCGAHNAYYFVEILDINSFKYYFFFTDLDNNYIAIHSVFPDSEIRLVNSKYIKDCNYLRNLIEKNENLNIKNIEDSFYAELRILYKLNFRSNKLKKLRNEVDLSL